MTKITINETVSRHKAFDPFLIAAVFLGVSLYLFSFLPFFYAGNARLIGAALVGIALTVIWPEFALVILGGSVGHSEFLLSPLKIPYSGFFFMAFAIILSAGAGFILMRRGFYRFFWRKWNWPLVFILVMVTWIVLYMAVDYVWIAKSMILNYYLIAGVFSGLILWYLVFSQSADVFRSGKSLLWATVVVNIGGLILNVFVTTGSLIPLFDPYSSFWTIGETSQRLSFGGFNENTIGVEFLASPAVAAFALLFSAKIRAALKAVLIGIISALGILISATGTRQAILGVGISLIIIILLAKPGQMRRAAIGIAFGLVFALFIISVLGEQFNISGFKQVAGLLSPGRLLAETTVSARFIYASRDIESFLQKPLIGQGLGFGAVHNLLDNPTSHNILTSIAAEIGIVPLLATMAFLWAVFRSIWHIFRLRHLSSEQSVVFQGLSGLFVLNLIALMISGRMSTYWFFGYGTGLCFLAEKLKKK